MPKFTCPFCLREYDRKQILYVCPDCESATKPSRFAREPIKCKTPGCGGLATSRVCPSCGEKIPQTALETPNLPFCIIGVSNSGKTNYITVMLHELARCTNPRLALGHQTQETMIHQKENFDTIYNKHLLPPNNNAGDKFPQIWYIKNLEKMRGNSVVPTYTFTIFDGAGEDHENRMDPSSSVCRYINVSEAIIITLDPLILPQVRNSGMVPYEVMRNSLGGEIDKMRNAVDVVNSVATYIKAARGIKQGRLLDIPVAVVLTKFDTLLDHKSFGPQAVIRNKSLTVRNGQVDMTEMKQVDEEIRNWLSEIGEGSFINALDANFKEYCFFGVSSYGKPPKSINQLEDEICPHRVLDPIFWLFKKANFID